MKNLIKQSDPYYAFKPDAFEPDTEYDLEIGEFLKTYKTYPERKPVPMYKGEPAYAPAPQPWIQMENLLVKGEPLPDAGLPDSVKYPRPYHWSPVKCPLRDVSEHIDFEAEHVIKGLVRIRKHGDTKWINPDDIIVCEKKHEIDHDKIKPGQIWKLTIDGDPRFQNTMIMILPSNGHRLRFIYQTIVIYATDYKVSDTAEGNIDLYHNDNKMIDISKVHLELITDNTNPNGSELDRTKNSEYIYPSSYDIGYREDYPAIEPRKRRSPLYFGEDEEE